MNTGRPKRYSERLQGHMITRMPLIHDMVQLPDILPASRDDSPIDFSGASFIRGCPIADPDRIRIASMIVRKGLHDRYRPDPEDE